MRMVKPMRAMHVPESSHYLLGRVLFSFGVESPSSPEVEGALATLAAFCSSSLSRLEEDPCLPIDLLLPKLANMLTVPTLIRSRVLECIEALAATAAAASHGDMVLEGLMVGRFTFEYIPGYSATFISFSGSNVCAGNGRCDSRAPRVCSAHRFASLEPSAHKSRDWAHRLDGFAPRRRR